MARLIDIDDERFWNILFDEACVEGQQATRIEKELEKIIAYDVEKVVEQIEKERIWRSSDSKRALGYAIEIVLNGGKE